MVSTWKTVILMAGDSADILCDVLTSPAGVQFSNSDS